MSEAAVNIRPETVFSGHVQSSDDLRRFMNHCIRLEIPDVFITVGVEARGSLNGRLVKLTSYKFQMEQIADMLRLIAGGDEVRTALAGKRDYDVAFSIPDEVVRDKFDTPVNHRFRLNATAIYALGGEGAQLVIRHIPADPPTLDQISFPDELRDEFAIKRGAFLVAGETGSGKTTTFAACLRHILEEETAIMGNIVTFESPAEYLLGSIESDHSVIAQTEIGKHLESFHDALRGAMRRKPALIVIGEMRDHETISSAIEASNTGHPVFGTIHATDASMILQRMVQRFPSFAQQQVFNDCLGACKLLMSQTLVPRVGGGRTCLRDWVVLTRQRQEELMAHGYEGHPIMIRRWMAEGVRAKSMTTSIEEAFSHGEIDQRQREICLKDYGD